MGIDEDEFHSSGEMSVRKKGIDRRRETSRYAARDRRGKEADIFVDLKEEVPLVEDSTVTHVDRIALLRVAATLCRMRQNAGKFLQQCHSELESADANEVEIWSEASLNECLDGFVIMADAGGMILYVTESVYIFLGLTQTDFIGRYLKDFIHQTDYDEFNRVVISSEVGNAECAPQMDLQKSIILRMKTVISPRGRTLNFKSALYKAIICRCRFIANAGAGGQITLIHGCSSPAGQGNQPSITGSPLVKGNEAASGVYMTRHTCDMKFTYVSDSLNYLLCQQSNKSLLGTSFYDLVHPADLTSLVSSFKELFRKGHCRTNYYRFLGANNAVVWAQTEAMTVNHTTKGQRGQYILGVHSILGMQSPMDCWASQINTVDKSQMEVPAAHPVHRNIKSEIVDVAEYFGKQPEFVDCVDFTPLIEPMTLASAMNLQQPTQQPAGRARRIQRANYEDDIDIGILNQSQIQSANCMVPAVMENDDSATGLNGSDDGSQSRTRKSSYEEVLQWLFCDDDSEYQFGTQESTNVNNETQSIGPIQYNVNQNNQRQNTFCAPSKNQYNFTGSHNTRSQSSGISRNGAALGVAPVPRTAATSAIPLAGNCSPQQPQQSTRYYSAVGAGRGPGGKPTGKWVSCSPAGRTSATYVSRGKPGQFYGGKGQKTARNSRYEQHYQQQQSEGKSYPQARNSIPRSNSEQQHNVEPISAVPVQPGTYTMPVNPGSTTNMQCAVPSSYRAVPTKFMSTKNQQQRSSNTSSFQTGARHPVAVVTPFNVNHLPTADPNMLLLQPNHTLLQNPTLNYSSTDTYTNKSDNLCQTNISEKQQYQQTYGNVECGNWQDKDDLCNSYKECEQLGAQLAPFLPQEEIFELCEDIAPLDIEGLFPEFDMADLFATAPQKITPELGGTTDVMKKQLAFGNAEDPFMGTSVYNIPHKKARFGSNTAYGLEFSDDPFLSAQ